MKLGRAEEARAVLIELFPEGFEELEQGGDIELAVYTDADGEERLRSVFGSIAAKDVPEDWPDRWRAFHRPVRVGAVWIGPPWEAAPADAVVVVVDPGRAFGTGAHATTRLCVEFLQLLPRGSLVDAGCGSGVLAVAAAKLGFAPVLAFDHDPAAIDATRDNAAVNGVNVEVRQADVLAEPLPETDIAVANISEQAIPYLQPRSPLAVTSGYLPAEQIGLPGYIGVERRELDGWAADLFRRRS